MANNVILREDEIASLDQNKLEQAKKKFVNTAYQVTKEVAPITGELSAYEYAMQDAQELARAARKEPGYEDMTPLEALGRVGMVGLGVLGTIPVIGYGPKMIRKGIASLMPKRTPASTARSPYEPLIREIRAGNQERIDSMTESTGYQEYVRNLPEYRRTPERERDNLIEYIQLSPTERNQFVEAGIERANATIPPMRITETSTSKGERKKLELETLQKNKKDYELTVAKNSNALVSKNTEPLTFGRGTTAKPTGTVKDYLGSEAFDYVNQYGNDASAKQWLGFLKAARQKGIKAEELEDAGVLIFKGDEVVGGEIFDIAKNSPEARLTKAEVLSLLETNPSFRMVEKDYNFPLHKEELIDLYPTLTNQGNELKRILTDYSFNLEKVSERAPFDSLNKDISDRIVDAADMLRRFSSRDIFAKNIDTTIEKIDSILPQLGDNDKLIARNFRDQLDTMKKLAVKGSAETKAPRHRTDFPEGGFDYREKVIYLNEPIAGNSTPLQVNSSHFNEPNVPVFVRYDTRGVDNYGDTLFIGEVQSDPHQGLRESFGKQKFQFDRKQSNVDPTSLRRNNPSAGKLSSSLNKNAKKDIQDKIQALVKKHQVEPLSKSEFDQLFNLRKEYNKLDAVDKRRPTNMTDINQATSIEQTINQGRGGRDFDTKALLYDYMPMGKEATWTQMAVKSMVNEARKRGKRYIALAPADLYQMTANETKKRSLKIERFYGLSPRKLPGRGIDGEFLGGPEAMGKYRDYQKDMSQVADAFEDAPIIGTGKIKGTADMVKAMQNVAKQIGAKSTVKRVYHTDPNKPYKLIYTGNNERSTLPSLAFKTKAERDIFLESKDPDFYKIVDIKDYNDPRNYIESVVIDIQGAKKGPMKAYKLGGLVEVKRELFAPLF